MSSVCSSSCTVSSHLDEDSSSWWEEVYEAADLHPDAQAKKSRMTQQDISLRYSGTKESTRLGYAALAKSDKKIIRLSPSDVKIAAAKLNLNSGKEHVSFSGKQRRARQIKTACHIKCNRCEAPRLKLSERQEIFDTFWNLSDHERQWLFIFGLVKTTIPRKKSSVGCGKKFSRHYSFSIAGSQKQVCKTMFKNTLCICDSWIDSALSHFSEDGYKPDMRGKVRYVRRKRGDNADLEAS
ncbi:uncharacterized protein LOC113218158 [Frankliniella occidentalis]|uniref:Uncharacterized protein LOC113218158 n=1 Tax=Frankliniella occidentalis TaxID=133901 RepID=A0A6J1TMY1_FRAOC|nr:uncharacterized protein LOC113218158 [Frankliniella occidentalis]